MSEPDYIAISGGFDPIHKGHIRMISDASCFGRLIVLLNTDEWLIRKKGSFFMDFEHRREIVESIKGVYCVLPAQDDDGTVCQSLEDLSCLFRYFGNGGDRGKQNTPEADICAKNNIKIIYGLGGGKIASSSELVNAAVR